MPNLSGVPDAWPHVAALLRAGGYGPDPARAERRWAGRLDGVRRPGDPPLAGLTVRRSVADPSTRGWADIWDFEVVEEERGRGIGSWLMSHAGEWLRLGGCGRIALSVAEADEAAGAGSFYERLGWRPLAAIERGWQRMG